MAEEKPKGQDKAIIIGKNEDGSYEVLRHHEDHRISHGSITPVKDGQPLSGDNEIINLSPADEYGMSNVKSVYKPPQVREKTGPAQVATEAYRSGWDNIFGSKVVGKA